MKSIGELRSAVGASLSVLALCGVVAAGGALAQAPALPKSPVTINVVDVAGDLALTQSAIEA